MQDTEKNKESKFHHDQLYISCKDYHTIFNCNKTTGMLI